MMRKKHRNKKRSLILLALFALAAVVAAVGGYAYFTSTGTGTGSATVGTSTTWQVTTAAAAGGPLTPGGAAGTYQTVGYTVKNNSTGKQSLADVNVKIAQSDGSAWSQQSNVAKPACTAADFQLSVDGTTFSAAGAAANDTSATGNLAPGATATGTITIRMVDSGANQDNCKSLTVPLYLAAS